MMLRPEGGGLVEDDDEEAEEAAEKAEEDGRGEEQRKRDPCIEVQLLYTTQISYRCHVTLSHLTYLLSASV